MKRLITILMCLVLSISCALAVSAAEVSQLPENHGGSQIMLVVALIIALGGSIYLFFKLKK